MNQVHNLYLCLKFLLSLFRIGCKYFHSNSLTGWQSSFINRTKCSLSYYTCKIASCFLQIPALYNKLNYNNGIFLLSRSIAILVPYAWTKNVIQYKCIKGGEGNKILKLNFFLLLIIRRDPWKSKDVKFWKSFSNQSP